MDVRLYKKAKSVADPFEFDKYRKKKIRETIEQDRTNRVQVNKLPKVNKDLALKLINDQFNKKKKDTATSLLNDNRFKGLFENPDFEVDKNTDEYRLLNPVLSRLDTAKKKELKKKLIVQEFEPVEVRNFVLTILKIILSVSILLINLPGLIGIEPCSFSHFYSLFL